MIKYSPREISGNVNISQKPPFISFLQLTLIVVLLLVIFYIILGVMVDVLVVYFPDKIEDILDRVFSSVYYGRASNNYQEAETYIQNILDSIVLKLDNPKGRYTVQIVDSPEVNAFALPGKRIIIYTGLLKKIDTENELAFVLAHELGHFVYRDHLRALGRNMVFFISSVILTGYNSGLSNFFEDILLKTEMKFSQRQEQKADVFAVDVLYKNYGHIGGAESFMKKLKVKEKLPGFFYFFSTHPHTDKRIRKIQKHAKIRGYTVGEQKSLPSYILDLKR